MYCMHCGAVTESSDKYCSICGQHLGGYPPEAALPGQQRSEANHVPNYLGWSAALLALCWPAWWAATVAIKHGQRVERHLATGDVDRARESSRQARQWCWATFWVGITLWTLALSLIMVW